MSVTVANCSPEADARESMPDVDFRISLVSNPASAIYPIASATSLDVHAVVDPYSNAASVNF